MLIVPSTTLNNPRIMYGNQTFTMDTSAQWDLAQLEFLQTTSPTKKPVTRSYVLLHESWVHSDRIDEIKKNFEKQMSKRNVGKAHNLKTTSINLKQEHRVNNLRAAFRQARKSQADLVVLVLSNRDQDVYSTFKHLADRIFGLHTMVFVEKSNYKHGQWNPLGLDQYVGNVMMKANLKFGGINHSAEPSSTKFGKTSDILKDTLVLGADVTHSGGGALPGCPSIAAVVGSVESTGGKFLGSIRLQGEANKEVSVKKLIR
jgi:eukaryotic translation initiation factor 2C